MKFWSNVKHQAIFVFREFFLLNQKIGPNQELWLQALESGDFPQGQKWLNIDGKYCCLGVGGHIFGCKTEKDYSTCNNLITYDGEEAYAPQVVVDKLALYNNRGGNRDGIWIHTLAWMNDKGYSFNDIALIVRSNPGAWFKETK